MKKFTFALFICLVAFSATVFAKNYDITNHDYNTNNPYYGLVPRDVSISDSKNSNYMYGDENYPIVGASDWATMFLDKKSCAYYIKGNKAYLACIVYYGSGGSDGHGNAGKHIKSELQFSTYKKNGKRVICFEKEVSQNRDETESTYKQDNGYLKSLFWKAATYSDLASYLD